MACLLLVKEICLLVVKVLRGSVPLQTPSILVVLVNGILDNVVPDACVHMHVDDHVECDSYKLKHDFYLDFDVKSLDKYFNSEYTHNLKAFKNLRVRYPLSDDACAKH